MSSDTYDDPQVESQWLLEQNKIVEAYLRTLDVQHRGVAQESDWFVAPYVSIWRVESMSTPGAIGWWAIGGDLPTDYVSSNDAGNAREALSAFANRWREVSEYMLRGEDHPTIRIGKKEHRKPLGELLSQRARIIGKWAKDDGLWP